MAGKEHDRSAQPSELTTEDLRTLDWDTLDIQYDWCPQCNGGAELAIVEKRIYIALANGKKSWYIANVFVCTNGCGFEMEEDEFIAEYGFLRKSLGEP